MKTPEPGTGRNEEIVLCKTTGYALLHNKITNYRLVGYFGDTEVKKSS